MFNFDRSFEGELINLRPESFTDRESGKLQTFFRVDLIAIVDDVRQAVQLTCGPRALGEAPEKLKPGQKVKGIVAPFARNNRVVPRLLSLSLA